jgi:peptide/nickel transport system substrate-binding protein
MATGRARGALCAAAAALALILAGCGDSDPTSAGGGESELAGEMLSYAIEGKPRESDPLLASSRPDQVIDRQVHEPLVDELAAPFGDERRERGLAVSWRASRDREIWSLHLRERVRFQDGTPFNSSAVLANVERWRTLAPGRALLPGLLAADAPRPDLVRLIFTQPVPDLPDRLDSPRLGIVSPAALRPRSGRSARLVRSGRSGTGPFEFRGGEGDRVIVARNVAWWGTRLELGPALDQVEFVIAPSSAERLKLLDAGDVQVVDSLPRSATAKLRRNPLLTTVGGGDEVIGLERSVRGIDSTSVQSLSGVWLTTVGTE